MEKGTKKENEDVLNNPTEDQSYTNKAFNASEYNVENQNTGNSFQNIELRHRDNEAISEDNEEISDKNVRKLTEETNVHVKKASKKDMNNELQTTSKDGITLSAVTLQNLSPNEDKYTHDFELKADGSLQKSVKNESELESENVDPVRNTTTDDFNKDCDIHDSSSGYSGSTFKRSLSYGDKPKRRKSHLQKNESSTNNDVKPTNNEGSEQSTSADSAFSDNSWRMPLERFTSIRQGSKRKQKEVSKDLRSYYKKQDELIDEFSSMRKNNDESFYKSQDDLINQYEEIRMEIDDAMEFTESERKLRKKASIYAKATFATNLGLLAIKVVAVVLSGSISLISSLVDSSVDLVSGIVIWVTTRAVKKTDRYVYPQGRTKLEPMAIVILAVIMSVASMQIIKESFTKIIGLADGSDSPPNMDWVTLGIASATVVVKLILFLLCRRIPHPTVQALALDHRNDVMSNSFAVIFGYLGSVEMQARVNAPGLVYIDPIGAIAISIYIIVNWVITGWDQIKQLIGHTATAAFLSKITWICIDHHKKIEKVDTVRAFHFGQNFLVEVDIVLPPEMTLSEAHDIAEPLQQKLERLPNVERAFVHIDYEVTHDPKSEHKVV